MADNVKKGTAKKAFAAAHEGRLTKLGWPSFEKLMASAHAGHRAEVMSGLNLLANMSGDPATKAKAASMRERMKKMKMES
jgi:hypothetical protein